MEKNKAYFLELKRERKVFPYSEFSSCTEDIEAAEGYWGEEQTELWQKSGTPKKISFPMDNCSMSPWLVISPKSINSLIQIS